MPGMKKEIQEALVEGATQGLRDKQLFEYVRSECPKAKTKKIVHAAFLALSDPDLKDRNILDVIYALALRYRLNDDIGEDDSASEPEQVPEASKAPKNRNRSSKAASLPLPLK